MKKYPVLVLLLFAMVILNAQSPSDYKFKSHISFLPMGTGSTTGTYYPLGFAFANVITSKNPDINVMALSTRGSLENIRLLKDREIKLAIVQSDVFYHAVKKTGRFASEDNSDLRALLSLFPEVVQIVLQGDSDISCINDLKGRKIILGEKGSGNLSTALAVLSCFGMDENDIEAGYLSYDAAISAMENREYDAFFLVAGLPTKVYIEMEKRMPIRILRLTSEEIAGICGKHDYLSAVSIAAGTYSNCSDPINTVALKALLIANRDLSDRIVFDVLKTIFDSIAYLKKMHPRAGDISMDSYESSIPEGYLHSGSEKYLERYRKK